MVVLVGETGVMKKLSMWRVRKVTPNTVAGKLGDIVIVPVMSS